jgi:hypothetical protein
MMGRLPMMGRRKLAGVRPMAACNKINSLVKANLPARPGGLLSACRGTSGSVKRSIWPDQSIPFGALSRAAAVT